MDKLPTSTGYRCYHCGSMETCKAGFSRFNGRQKQKYYCRSCKRYFRENLELGPATGKEPNFWVRKDLPSAGHLILELRAVAQSLGRTPTVNDIRERSKKGRGQPLTSYRAVFGGFREALRRARLTPDYPRKYPPEQMIAELRRLRKDVGRPLLLGDVQRAFEKGKAPSFYFLKRAFGSVSKAMEAAGVARKRSYTEEEMIGCLRKLDAKLDHPVRRADINQCYQQGECPSVDALVAMFGSLTKAARRAGLKKRQKRHLPVPHKERRHKEEKRRRTHTDEKLIADLKSLGEKLGRRPTHADILQAQKEGTCAGPTAYHKRFGGVLEACRRAGFPEPLLGKSKTPLTYTDEEIIAALKQLTNELGRFPTYDQIRAASLEGKCPNEKTIVARLGRLADIRGLLNGKD